MFKKLFAAGILLQIFALPATAATIQCSEYNPDVPKNYMELDSSVVSACAMSGVGNLSGELGDQFLTANPDYSPAGKIEADFDAATPNPYNISFTQATDPNVQDPEESLLPYGTFTFSGDFWNTYSAGAIAFKFGTGNQPDEWFVYHLVAGVTSGNWNFINVHKKGGGLSHVHLYGELSPVPVPAAIPLFLTALAAFGLFRRRQVRV